MLLTFKINKKRGLGFKVKFVRVGKNSIVLYAPKPKTRHQKKKLIMALAPYEGNIIYPKGFDATGYPKPYPLEQVRRKNKLISFLRLCKKERPNTAVIVAKGVIKSAYYFDISPFVGKIILPDTPFDEELQRSLLAFSGTPVIFGGEIPNSDNKTKILLM